jgi:FlaA1/EpsC-like NDP-sugar epimerase
MIGSRPARAVARIAFKVRDRHRRPVSFGLYGLVIAAAYAAAFFIRFELTWPRDHTVVYLATLPELLLIRLTLARLFRLSTSRWRFTGTQDLVRLVLAMSAGTVIFFVVTWYLRIPMAVSRSVIALEWVLSSYGIGGMWLTYRLLFQGFRRRSTGDGHADRRVLLIGAGEAAALLLGEMTRFPTGYRPVGMVDDNPLRWGLTIHGVEVIGSVDDLQPIAEVERVDELIIAIPSAGPEELSRIVERCEQTELPFRILPGIPEVLAGKADLNQLRPVQIDDLLGRQPVTLELPELAGELAGKCVLVTGAAGSIGSELSHQIALHGPRRLVLLDQAESPLVELDLRLREKFPHQTIVSVVGDVTHARGIADVFAAHGPAWVFHAAAYKHVPMMQHNATEAVRNNVLGTWILARTAAQWGSHKFILVSTDKAVRPVNVMGATKRLAELIVLEAQERFPMTSFGAVRFGNVLGSNGSVIPLFQSQLEAGKPLTVTHPDISRYFMTIPEAVQLMLQASLLPGLRGNVAMLDMGEPVKIVDLAKRILRLSGSPARVGEDIVFIGLRPGEKLHEELVGPDENTVATANPQVRLVLSPDVGRLRVLGGLAAWERAHVEGRDGTNALLGLLHRGASGTGERVASAHLSV